MRKYYQAGLALITIVSVVSFLFYRHEYNKLHYVLEVFNYFGEPHIKVEPPTNCSVTADRPPHVLSEPIPAWTRLDNNTYVYSAHNINYNIVRAIAFAKVDNLKLSSLRCAVYFFDDTVTQGHVNFNPIEHSLDDARHMQGYYFNCNFKTSDGDDNNKKKKKRPIGVKYFAEYNDVEDAVMIAVRSVPDKLDGANESAICVTPSEQLASLEMKLSFVTIHNVFGVNYFVVYDYGLDSWFNAEMRRNSKKTLVYETVPWNFPFPIKKSDDDDLMKSLIQADCMLRTRNVTKYSTVMQWTDFIIPKYHEQIEHLLFDLHRNRLIAHCYAIHVSSFCTQQRPTNIFKLTSAFTSVHAPPVLICKPNEILDVASETVANASKSLIQVHRYNRCSIDDYTKEQTIQDESVLALERVVMHAVDNFQKANTN